MLRLQLVQLQLHLFGGVLVPVHSQYLFILHLNAQGQLLLQCCDLQAITLNNLLQLNNFCNHLCLAIVVLFQQKFNLSLRFPFLVVQLQKKSPFQLLFFCCKTFYLVMELLSVIGLPFYVLLFQCPNVLAQHHQPLSLSCKVIKALGRGLRARHRSRFEGHWRRWSLRHAATGCRSWGVSRGCLRSVYLDLCNSCLGGRTLVRRLSLHSYSDL
mmetsp:Transcript_4494/g.7225  ORF Transcript_4494/g.7225 Transcript_4494/m.7225 type:complete len:213 (+) Transcript_4494:1213-1851(+)